MDKETERKENILKEVAFSMECEGFTVTEEQKEAVRDVLNGKVPFQVQLQKYLDKAYALGGKASVNRT